MVKIYVLHFQSVGFCLFAKNVKYAFDVGRIYLYSTDLDCNHYAEKVYYWCADLNNVINKLDNVFVGYSFSDLCTFNYQSKVYIVSLSFCTIYMSEWFKRINFAVTQFTSYINERDKNFPHDECEEHFYPHDSQSKTHIDDYIAALRIVDFGGLLSICLFMVVKTV
jgi:hypothetical protein